jgi:hypothetical protein
MARPEQTIHGVTVGCGGRMAAICDASTIPHVVDSGYSCVCSGAWSLVVLVTLLEFQSVGVWQVGSPGFLVD